MSSDIIDRLQYDWYGSRCVGTLISNWFQMYVYSQVVYANGIIDKWFDFIVGTAYVDRPQIGPHWSPTFSILHRLFKWSLGVAFSYKIEQKEKKSRSFCIALLLIPRLCTSSSTCSSRLPLALWNIRYFTCCAAEISSGRGGGGSGK